MRIIVNGRQAFGKSVLEALVDRGEDVVGAYCAPDEAGRRADPLKEYALERGIPVFQPRSFRRPEVREQMASLGSDLCLMAYVTLFVPQAVLDTPTRGTIQYHPSLLPRHRGPSSINWPIIWGESKTGLSIFWPDEGLDEGPLLLQRTVEIGDSHTLGTLYFNHLFPMGVDALLESVDRVRDGTAPRREQDHAAATYEGWCRHELVQVNWHLPLLTTWNLVRGADPAPGAWTTFEGAVLALHDAEKIDVAKSIQPGEVSAVDSDSLTVAAPDGQLRIKRIRPAGEKKVSAGEWAARTGIGVGARLGIS